ncbi:MAG TPA: type II toxin-antitoxin system RelE/ParE family toxin [Candidatus Cloacimonetes bacterium]|nr:type II toxin-antitoxin system RelE/ParE family toxin [Candidatus Cloacimonadota bacterium]
MKRFWKSMTYKIKWDKRAYKELKGLETNDAIKILNNLHKLPENPYSPGNELKGKFKNKFKLRIGDFGLIYWIEEKEKNVWIIAIGNRKDVYK